MPEEPTTKRAITFIDGQNLFFGAKDAFGYSYPNYDVGALSQTVCDQMGWQLDQVRFYTGVPDRSDNERWSNFWAAKLLTMSRQGIWTYTRPLRYQNKTFKLPDGSKHTMLVAEEKGVDVRIALDVIRLAHAKRFDVAVIFSQDQDLSEAADEVRVVSQEQNRWLKIAFAFPESPALNNLRGINKTDWIKIDRATYGACLDPNRYLPKT